MGDWRERDNIEKRNFSVFYFAIYVFLSYSRSTQPRRGSIGRGKQIILPCHWEREEARDMQ